MQRFTRPRWCGIACVFAGWLALNFLLHCRWTVSHWSATILLHDFPRYGLASLASCMVALSICDPWRALRRRTAVVHGFLLGAACRWLYFVLAECDLFARDDKLFCFYCGVLGAVITGRAFGAWSVYFVLRRRRNAPFRLRVERLASLSDSLSRGPAQAPLEGRQTAGGDELFPSSFARWFDRWNSLRCRIGLGPSRAYHIERALEREVDDQTGRWRAALDQLARSAQALASNQAGTVEIGAQCAAASELGLQTVQAFEWELSLVRAASVRGESTGGNSPDWLRRWVVLWDLACEQQELVASLRDGRLRDDKASAQWAATAEEQQRRLLDAIRGFVQPTTERWLRLEPPRDSRGERERERQLARLCQRLESTTRRRGLRAFLASVWERVTSWTSGSRSDSLHSATSSAPAVNGPSSPAGAQATAWERQLIAVVLSECLLREGLSLWIPSVLDRLVGADAPRWLMASLNRLRAAAERRVLGRSNRLSEADRHWRRSFGGVAGVAADTPKMRAHCEADADGFGRFEDAGFPDAPAISLRGARLPNSRRRTRGRSLPRPGYDPGPGRWLLTSAGCSLIFAWLAIVPPPWGAWSPVKSLRFLFRPPHVHEAPIADAALDATQGRLLLATDGNGLHTVDLRTHHVFTDDRANDSLASNHLGSVAVTERGVVGVSTIAKSVTKLPSGVDVKFDGRWRTLIQPAACETPGGGEIEFTFRLPDSAEGAEQLLVTRRGLLIYHHARRSLRAVERRDASTGADDDRILAKLSAAALIPETGEVWLATEATPGPRIVAIKFHEQRRKYSIAPANPAFPDTETVEQLVSFGPRLWARTRSGRLHEWSGDHWRLLADGGRDLDLTRVRHALIGVGPTPALWLIEQDEAGVVTGIRARLFPDRHRLATSGSTWQIVEPRRLEQFPLSGSGDRALDSPYPVARYDDRSQRHELFLPGKESGVVRVRMESSSLGGGGDATLAIDRVETGAETVLRLDSDGVNLLMLLESSSSAGRRRRIVAVQFQQLDRWSAVAPVHDAWAPGPEVAGASVVAAAGDESGVWLVCDSGRVVRYSTTLHGLTDPRGAELTLDNGPVGKLISGDFSGSRLVTLDQQGRVVGMKRPTAERGSAATELLHRFTGESPATTDQVRRVATEPDGIELFMSDGKAGDGLVAPWTYRLRPRPGSWLGLTPSAPKGVQLQVDSLTRLQSDTRVGPLLAIGSNTLMWRTPIGWRPVPGASGGSHDLWSAEGATFVRGEAGLLQITLPLAEGVPPGLASWWSPPPAHSVLPSALAGVDVGGRGRLLSAHRQGLSEYDPVAQHWRRHSVSADLANAEKWTLAGRRDERGLCRVLWAAPTDATDFRGVRHLARIVGGSVESLDLGQNCLQATATGERFATLLADRRLAVLSDRGPAVELLPGEVASVGDVRLTRMATGRRVYSLDDKGRLLQTDLHGRSWGPVPSLTTLKPPQLDFDVAADDSVIVAGADDIVRRLDPQGGVEEVARVPKAMVERVGDRVALIDKSSRSLASLDSRGRQPVIAAGGLTNNKMRSQPHAMLAAGAELYLAGDGGVGYRDPQARRMLPVTGPEKVDRFETIGAHRLARTSDGAAFQLTKDAAKNLGAATSVVAGPSGKLWLLPRSFASLRAATDAERLYEDQAENRPDGDANSPPEWPAALTHVAPLDEWRVVLVERHGRLAAFDSRRRALQLVPGLTRDEAVVEVRRIGERLIVSTARGERPGGAQGPNQADSSPPKTSSGADQVGNSGRACGLYVVEAVPLRAKLIELADDTPLFTGSHFAWRRGALLREWPVGGDPRTFATLPAAPKQPQPPFREVLAGQDGQLWGTDGATAFAFHWERGIVRTVAGVASIARVDGKVVGIAREREVWRLLDLTTSQPLTPPYSRVNVGAGRISLWKEDGGVRTWETFSGVRGEVSSTQFAPPSDLGTARDSGYTSVDGRRVFMLDKAGAVVCYDTARGDWATVNAGDGWTELGRRGQYVVARRESGGQSELHELQIMDATGTLGRRFAAPGAAWFDDRGLLQLDEPTAGSLKVSYVEFGGGRSDLTEFRRATKSFDSGQVWRSGERRIGLLRNKSSTRFIVAQGEVVREAENSYDGELDASRANRDLAYQPDQLLFIDGRKRLVDVNTSTGIVNIRASDVVAAGRIGSQLWSVVAEKTGLSVKSLERPVGVPLPIQQLLRRARIECQFVKAGEEFALRVKLKPLGDSSAPDRTLVLVERPQGLAVLQWGGGHHPVAPSAGRDLEQIANAADGGLALIDGRLLRLDGWWAHLKPVGFGRLNQVGAARERPLGTPPPQDSPVKPEQADVVPLMMSDGTVAGLRTKTATLTTALDGPQGVSVRDGRLYLGSKLQLGEIRGRQPLACDQWLDATTDPEGRLLAMDGEKRVWRWELQGRASVRSLIDLPPGTTPADLGLAETSDAGLHRAGAAAGAIREAFRWTPAGPGFRFEIRVARSDGPPKWLATHVHGGGAELHQIGALRMLAGSNSLWLELPTPTEESQAGRKLICPATGDDRYLKLRLVDSSALSPPLAPSAFDHGGLRFTPGERGWRIFEATTQAEIPIKSGQLAIDRLRSAAATTNPQETRLYLLTDFAGKIVRLRWTKEGVDRLKLLPGPKSDREPDELRTRAGRALVRVGDDWFELDEREADSSSGAAIWRPTTVDWRECVSSDSPWRFASKLTYKGAATTMVVDSTRGLCIGADALSLAETSPGQNLRCETPGPLVYQAIDGSWYQAAPGEVVSLPWAAPPPRETASEFQSAGLTFPRRPAAVADYQLASAEGPLRLPLKLSAGRLPHWDVVAIAPRGPDALLLSFGRGDAAKPADSPLCFGTTRPVGDGWAPIGYSLRRPPESPAPNYTRHDECEIAPETRRRLSWKPVDGKWLLTLTAPDAATISLGWLDERGLAIDQPARVRPVLLSRDEVEFEFDGRVWRKPKGGRLDQFRLIPDARLRPSRLAVDEAGRMRHWTDAVPTLSDPSLGAFATEAASGDDKYSPDTSVQAVVRGDGPDVTLTLTSKASHGGDGLDLSARATGADGKWRFPFQQPQEVVMASDEMLVLRDESTEAVWRLPSAAGETPVSLLKILDAANMCESLRRSANKNRVTTDSFRLERRPSLRFHIETKRSDQSAWSEHAATLERGLPGSWPTAVAAAGQDLLIQDQIALFRRRTAEARYESSLALPDATPRMIRHAHRLLLPPSKPSSAVKSLFIGAEGQIETTAVGEHSGRVACGKDWGVEQELPHAPVEVTLAVGDESLALHPQVDGRVAAGPLALDVVRLVRAEARDGAALFTSIGAYRVADSRAPSTGGGSTAAADSRLEVASAEVRDWLSTLNDWRNLYDLDGRRSIGARNSTSTEATSNIKASGDSASSAATMVLVADDGLRLRPRTDVDCEYQSFELDGWKVKRDANSRNLSLSRPLKIDGQRVDQHLFEDEVFEEGQMSFDHVRHVALDGAGRLVVQTSRTVERLVVGEDGRPELQVAALSGSPFEFLTPAGTVELRRADDESSRTVSFECDGRRLHVPVPRSNLADENAGGGDSRGDEGTRGRRLPRAFAHGERIWVIDPSGVSWVEGARRWSGRRHAELERDSKAESR